MKIDLQKFLISMEKPRWIFVLLDDQIYSCRMTFDFIWAANGCSVISELYDSCEELVEFIFSSRFYRNLSWHIKLIRLWIMNNMCKILTSYEINWDFIFDEKSISSLCFLHKFCKLMFRIYKFASKCFQNLQICFKMFSEFTNLLQNVFRIHKFAPKCFQNSQIFSKMLSEFTNLAQNAFRIHKFGPKCFQNSIPGNWKILFSTKNPSNWSNKEVLIGNSKVLTGLKSSSIFQ